MLWDAIWLKDQEIYVDVDFASSTKQRLELDVEK